MAYVVFALLGWLGWRLRRATLAHPGPLDRRARWQLVTGLSNVVLGWLLLARRAHRRRRRPGGGADLGRLRESGFAAAP